MENGTMTYLTTYIATNGDVYRVCKMDSREICAINKKALNEDWTSNRELHGFDMYLSDTIGEAIERIECAIKINEYIEAGFNNFVACLLAHGNSMTEADTFYKRFCAIKGEL